MCTIITQTIRRSVGAPVNTSKLRKNLKAQRHSFGPVTAPANKRACMLTVYTSKRLTIKRYPASSPRKAAPVLLPLLHHEEGFVFVSNFCLPSEVILCSKEVPWDVPGKSVGCVPGSHVRRNWKVSALCLGHLGHPHTPPLLPSHVLRMPFCRLGCN